MKHLRSDKNGTEKLMPSVIILLTFVLLTAFLISMLPSSMNANGGTGNQIFNQSELINGTSYTPIDPSAGRSYTWANASTTFSAGQSYFHPVDNNGNPISSKTVRNNTYPWFAPIEWTSFDNYYALERNVGFFAWQRYSISYPAITDQANRTVGGLYANFTIILGTDTYLLSFHAHGNFTRSMFNNNTFTAKMFVPTSSTVFHPSDDDMLTSIWNFFSALSSLLFGYSVPGNWIVSYIISIGIWAASLFIGFMMMTRAIHGGG